jgi:hypothetical protein
MADMFKGAVAFNQDLSSGDTSNRASAAAGGAVLAEAVAALVRLGCDHGLRGQELAAVVAKRLAPVAEAAIVAYGQAASIAPTSAATYGGASSPAAWASSSARSLLRKSRRGRAAARRSQCTPATASGPPSVDGDADLSSDPAAGDGVDDAATWAAVDEVRLKRSFLRSKGLPWSKVAMDPDVQRCQRTIRLGNSRAAIRRQERATATGEPGRRPADSQARMPANGDSKVPNFDTFYGDITEPNFDTFYTGEDHTDAEVQTDPVPCSDDGGASTRSCTDSDTSCAHQAVTADDGSGASVLSGTMLAENYLSAEEAILAFGGPFPGDFATPCRASWADVHDSDDLLDCGTVVGPLTPSVLDPGRMCGGTVAPAGADDVNVLHDVCGSLDAGSGGRVASSVPLPLVEPVAMPAPVIEHDVNPTSDAGGGPDPGAAAALEEVEDLIRCAVPLVNPGVDVAHAVECGLRLARSGMSFQDVMRHRTVFLL